MSLIVTSESYMVAMRAMVLGLVLRQGAGLSAVRMLCGWSGVCVVLVELVLSSSLSEWW